MIPIDLEGRVVLVCGAARGGISGATVRRVGEAGATIVAVDREQAILDETIADVEAAGGRCHGIVADLMDPAGTDPIVRDVVARCGRLDGVANVAGGTREEEWMCLEDMPTRMFRETLLLNLEYVFRICRDAAAWMIAAGVPGSFVNVGSVSGLTSAPFHGPYGAAKSGLFALTRTMAIEWKPHGIRANTVSPGAVATARVINRASNPESPLDMSEFTSPDELAFTIAFLLSDLASGISGQNLAVDGGLSARHCSNSFDRRRPAMLAQKERK